MKRLLTILALSVIFVGCTEEPVPPAVLIEDLEFDRSINRYAPATFRTITFSIEETTGLAEEPITFLWDFGDGQTMEGTDVQHTYNGFGEFRTSVTILMGEQDAIMSPIAIQIGQSQMDRIVGYSPKGKSYYREIQKDGLLTCIDPELDPCPEDCCLSDDVHVFTSNQAFHHFMRLDTFLVLSDYEHFQNQFNECICLDEGGVPVNDLSLKMINYFTEFDLEIPMDESNQVTNADENGFVVVRPDGHHETFVAFPGCADGSTEAVEALQLSKSSETCACGNFDMVTNQSNEHVVALIEKYLVGEFIEEVRVELAPGEVFNLGCDNYCGSAKLEMSIECASYFTPLK